jgi:hypothetical protein
LFSLGYSLRTHQRRRSRVDRDGRPDSDPGCRPTEVDGEALGCPGDPSTCRGREPPSRLEFALARRISTTPQVPWPRRATRTRKPLLCRRSNTSPHVDEVPSRLNRCSRCSRPRRSGHGPELRRRPARRSLAPVRHCPSRGHPAGGRSDHVRTRGHHGHGSLGSGERRLCVLRADPDRVLAAGGL